MARIIGGIVIGIVAVFLLSMALIMFEPALDQTKASDVLNCKGYIDSSDSSLSYNASLETNTSACTVLNSTSALFALAVVVGIFMGIIYGNGATPLETPEY